MGTPQAHCQTQHCEDFWEWFPETNFVFNFVEIKGNSCELTSCGEVLGIYVAIVGIVMSNMLSNSVKVWTSFDKPI